MRINQVTVRQSMGRIVTLMRGLLGTLAIVRINVRCHSTLRANTRRLHHSYYIVRMTRAAYHFNTNVIAKQATWHMHHQFTVRRHLDTNGHTLHQPVNQTPNLLTSQTATVNRVAHNLHRGPTRNVKLTSRSIQRSFVTPIFKSFFPTLVNFLGRNRMQHTIRNRRQLGSNIS